MPIQSQQCTPYLSVSLYKSKGNVAADVSALLSSIREIARTSADQKGLDKPRFPNVGDPDLNISGTTLTWAHYAVKRPPSWLDGPGLVDIHNHLIVVAKRGDGIAKLFVAVCEGLARVVSCRHFGGVVSPKVESIGAGVAV